MESPEKVFQCYECPDGMQIFASEEALLTHKWDMIRMSRRKSHMCCHVCQLDHHTFEGLVRHYQLQHPAEQTLACPGCTAPFKRLHLLLAHLEHDECPNISAACVVENRILQVQATNLLAAGVVASGGGGSVRGGPCDLLCGGFPSGPAGTMAAMIGPLRRGGGDDDGDNEDNDDDAANTSDGGAAVAQHLQVQEQQQHQERQLGIFDVSGVAIGDFGRFIGIDPHTAAAVAANVERAAAGAGVGASAGAGAAMGRGVPPTSAEAAEETVRRQRQAAFGGGLVNVGSGTSGTPGSGPKNLQRQALAAPAVSRAVEAFRRGDSKAPDLLTDGPGPGQQAARRRDVWAGQGMVEPERGGHGPGLPALALQNAGLAGGGHPWVGPGPAGPSRLSSSAAAAAAAMVPSQDPDDVHHPTHPRFNVFRYRDRITGRFSCPHEACQRSGKQFKTSGGLVAHLRSDTAHSAVRMQCPSCFKYFPSVEALVQHCTSQSGRCHFRESEDYHPFLNIATAGVAEVSGRNVDMTLTYSVQATARDALLPEGMYPGAGRTAGAVEGAGAVQAVKPA